MAEVAPKLRRGVHAECQVSQTIVVGRNLIEHFDAGKRVRCKGVSLHASSAGEIEVSECHEGPGADGVPHLGPSCLSRQSYVRTALIEGPRQEEEIGVNPFKFGLSVSTDTHGGIGGVVDEADFPGHLGIGDAKPADGVSLKSDRTGGISSNPGGLIGVWAEQNTRDSIFDAMQRREVFGTSGPRMKVRFHGSWGYEADLCQNPRRLARADEYGVAMGSDLRTRPSATRQDASPSFLVMAQADPGTQAAPGTDLQRVTSHHGLDQRGRGSSPTRLRRGGRCRQRASVDLDTSEPIGEGHRDLCTVWRDPDFDASKRAVYYIRAVENLTCRHSHRDCLGMDPAERPETCQDTNYPNTIQERAGSSPIGYTPGIRGVPADRRAAG